MLLGKEDVDAELDGEVEHQAYHGSGDGQEHRIRPRPWYMGCPTASGQLFSGIIRSYARKAGVDPSRIKYWEDLLDAVKKCKANGITPMAVAGSEKWPLFREG